MKIAATILFSLCLCSTVFARLGDTEEQAQARYGLQKRQPILPPGLFPPLIDGAREVIFEYEGWKIRCAFLKATDGREYVVSEEYTKPPNGKARQKTGILITDFEREAILKGEAGVHSWHQKTIGESSKDHLQTLANQLARASGLVGKIWIRDDGAIARTLGDVTINLILELPQALKYEAELKAIKEKEAKATMPKF